MIDRLEKIRAFAAIWWARRASREQQVLRLGGTILLPIFLVFGFWLPVAEKIDKLERQSVVLEMQLLEIRGLQGALGALGKSADASDAAALSAALPADLPERLSAEVLALHPETKASVRRTDNGIAVQIDAVEFDRILPWLHRLSQRENLYPAEVLLTAAPTSGWVSGRIRLQSGVAR